MHFLKLHLSAYILFWWLSNIHFWALSYLQVMSFLASSRKLNINFHFYIWQQNTRVFEDGVESYSQLYLIPAINHRKPPVLICQNIVTIF